MACEMLMLKRLIAPVQMIATSLDPYVDGGSNYVFVDNLPHQCDILGLVKDLFGRPGGGTSCGPAGNGTFVSKEIHDVEYIQRVIRKKGKIAGGIIDVHGGPVFEACCKCISTSIGWVIRYKFVLAIDIQVVDVGVRYPYGGKKRTRTGRDRSESHERLHVKNFERKFDEIAATLKSEFGDEIPVDSRTCELRLKLLREKMKKTSPFGSIWQQWKEAEANEYGHVGNEWEGWSKQNGPPYINEAYW